MHHHSHSVQSAAIRRVFSAFIIASLLMAVLPHLAPPVAEAQETATYIAEKYNCQPGFDPSTTNGRRTRRMSGTGDRCVFHAQHEQPDYPGDTRNTSSGQASGPTFPSAPRTASRNRFPRVTVSPGCIAKSPADRRPINLATFRHRAG